MKNMLEQAKYIVEREPADSGRWKAGHHARFLQVNPLWGVKFYQNPKIREYSWNLQNIAYKRAGLAPLVGDWIDCRLVRDRTVALPRGPGHPNSNATSTEPLHWVDGTQCNILESDTLDDCPIRYGYLTMVADIEKDKSTEDIINLGKKLREFGFHTDFNDNSRMYNFGYFRDKLVPIDFEAMWLFRIVPMPNQSFGRLRLYPETTPAIGKILNWRYTPDKEC